MNDLPHLRYSFVFATLLLFTPQTSVGQNQPTFEVASIKLADLSERIRSRSSHMGAKIDGARADFGAMSLRELIQFAFRIKYSFQISHAGDPEACFDILAKLPPGTTTEEVHDMLQQLLIERFHLTFHWESREFPVYALVVAPKGAKLTPATQDFDLAANRTLPRNQHVAPMTMDRFAHELSGFLDKPLVNQTATEGLFLIPKGRMSELFQQWLQALIASQSGNDPSDSLHDYTNISAMLAELGLKMEPRKLPFPVLAIDKLDKIPTEQ